MKYSYIIPEIPPSNNQYIGRTNYHEYQREKKRWAELIYYLTRKDRPEKPIQNAVVELQYYFKTKTRRDPDNYSGKMILDGLVKAGIIADDSFNNIDLILRGNYDKNEPRTKITIEGVNQ